MRKIKLVLTILFTVVLLNSCTLLAVGAGAAAGGYTCTNTNLCNKMKRKDKDVYENSGSVNDSSRGSNEYIEGDEIEVIEE